MIRRSSPPLPAIWLRLSSNDTAKPFPHPWCHLSLKEWRPWGCSTYCSDKQALPSWRSLCTPCSDQPQDFCTSVMTERTRSPPSNSKHFNIQSITLPGLKWDNTLCLHELLLSCKKFSVQNISGTSNGGLGFGFITVLFSPWKCSFLKGFLSSSLSVDSVTRW